MMKIFDFASNNSHGTNGHQHCRRRRSSSSSSSGKSMKKSEIIYRLFGRGGVVGGGGRARGGLWPIAILIYGLLLLQLFGSSMAFTILSPFSYTSLSFKNLLNSVLLSSNANLAGGGRNLKSDVLEDASLITVSKIQQVHGRKI